MFGRQELAAEVYKEVGLGWDDVDEWLDTAATSFGRLRPRGNAVATRDPDELREEVDNTAFCVEGCSFMAKCAYEPSYITVAFKSMAVDECANSLIDNLNCAHYLSRIEGGSLVWSFCHIDALRPLLLI